MHTFYARRATLTPWSIEQAPFIEVVKVLTHARVPILKAIATSGGGEKPSIGFEFKVDISIDGPTHTGLATSAFVSYLADHLPNLVPLTIVLKSLLQVHKRYMHDTVSDSTARTMNI